MKPSNTINSIGVLFIIILKFLVNFTPLSDCAHCISNKFRSENENISYFLLLIGIILSYLFYNYYKNQKNNYKQVNLSILVFITLFLTLMWYLPFADHLFEWFRVGMFNLQDYNPVVGFKENWTIIWPNWVTLFLYLTISFVAIFYYFKLYKKNNFKIFFQINLPITYNRNNYDLCLFYIIVNRMRGITPIRRTAPAVFLLAAGVIAYTGIGKDFSKNLFCSLPIIILSFGVILSSFTAFFFKIQ